MLVRLAAIAIIIAGVVGAFAYTGGWFSPHRLTPARFIDTFEKVNGIHPGFRRNHAKGVCVSPASLRATATASVSRKPSSSGRAAC
jgi:catalase